MDLNHLTDNALIEQTKNLVHKEREILTDILHHLREIERRRLYSKCKYPSLFAYATSELKYSEPQAIRRISAMRLLRDISFAQPDSQQRESQQLESKINSGALSLTNLVLAQKLFSTEKKAGRPMNFKAKAQVLAQLENQSTRQAEKIVSEISPEMKSRKREFEFHQIEDDQLREKLLRLKGHFAHKYPNMNLHELLHHLCDEKLEWIERSKAPKRAGDFKSTDHSPAAPKVVAVAKSISQCEVRRNIWGRDQGRCTNCHSTFAIEIDHITPQAKGGPSSSKNLRLLCRACNQRSAIEHFGLTKMARHLQPRV